MGRRSELRAALALAGSPRRDVPDELGPWSTVWNSFDRWHAHETIAAVLDRLRVSKVDSGEIDDQIWCIDGTIVRAARCASGGGNKGIRRNRKTMPSVVPVALAGDKGYRADWVDAYLPELGIQPVIPSKEAKAREARGIKFDREAYRDRNIIQRLIGWLKKSRRIFLRFEKTARNFAGMIRMAYMYRYLPLATE